MALNELLTLIKVKADTSQAKTEMRSLRGAERQAMKERVSEMEKHNKTIDDQLEKYAKIGVAIGATVAAVKIAQAAMQAYLEDVRLESAATGANIEGLRKATRGLVETDHLLAFAGKAMHGVWKLNQTQMESVLRGAVALRKTMGVELQPTIEALTEAVAKGSTRALKEFGIEAKTGSDVVRELDRVVKSLGGNVGLTGDEMKRAGVKIANAMDDAAGKMGEAVLKLAPLVEGFAGLVSVLGDFIGLVTKLPDWLVPDSSHGGKLSARQQLVEQGVGYQNRARWLRENARAGSRTVNLPGIPAGAGFGAEGMDSWVPDTATVGYSNAERAAMLKEAAALEAQARHILIPELIRSGKETIDTINGAILGAQRDSARKAAAAIRGGRSGSAMDPRTLAGIGGAASAFGGVPGGLIAAGQAGYGGWKTDIDRLNLADKMRSDSLRFAPSFGAQAKVDADEAKRNQELKAGIEGALGTSFDLDASTEAIKLASAAFDGLRDAAIEAFDAWITGSEDAATAFKHSIANILKALADTMFANSINELAMAFASLALPGLHGSAGLHFKAAALFAGGAVVAGGLAKTAGSATGQWSHSSGAGAGTGNAPRTISNGSTSGQNGPITIYVGTEWAALSSIEQSGALVRAIQLGQRGSSHIRRH